MALNYHAQQGITLFELMITLALVAILASLALPAFEPLIKRNQVQVLTLQLTRSLAYARSQAITQHAPISLCGSSNGSDCSASWQSGWRIYQPNNQQTLRFVRLESTQLQLQWRGFRPQIHYLADGTTPTSNGRLLLCAQDQLQQLLILNRQGRLRTANLSERQENQAFCQ